MGSFFANMTGQFAGTNLADIQGSVGASADEASWIATIYTIASFAGIILAPALLKTLGLRRYFVANAVLFATSAWLCALATSLPMLQIMRALQGLAAGAFGPIAFTAVFVMCKGPRLPWGISLLAFVLLVSVNAGLVLSAPIEATLGWRGLFVAQLWGVTLLALAALRWMPVAPLNRDGLKTDWGAVTLLTLATGALVLVLSQGTRRFWLDSPVVAWSLSLGIGALIGFAVIHRYSTVRIIRVVKLLDRRFGIPILLNLVFRASFAVTIYLIPLLLTLTQSYRPLQISHALWWCLLPQLAAFPLAWKLLHQLDSRVVMVAGLLLVGLGIWLASCATGLVAGEQLRASLVLLGIGQMLFLVPNLLVGASSVKPEDGPTATIAFNISTLGGTTLGVGLASHLATERQKLHSNVLVDHVSWLDPLASDRLSALAGAWSTRIGDDMAGSVALANLGATVRREAWLLAINDSFAVIAAIVIAGIVGVALIGRCPPLSRPVNAP